MYSHLAENVLADATLRFINVISERDRNFSTHDIERRFHCAR